MDNEGCSGCGDELTLDNIGGYRCYCEKCINVFPEFPSTGLGYSIIGKYPKFTWCESENN